MQFSSSPTRKKKKNIIFIYRLYKTKLSKNRLSTVTVTKENIVQILIERKISTKHYTFHHWTLGTNQPEDSVYLQMRAAFLM